jgi:hypothetical protein
LAFPGIYRIVWAIYTYITHTILSLKISELCNTCARLVHLKGDTSTTLVSIIYLFIYLLFQFPKERNIYWKNIEISIFWFSVCCHKYIAGSLKICTSYLVHSQIWLNWDFPKDDWDCFLKHLCYGWPTLRLHKTIPKRKKEKRKYTQNMMTSQKTPPIQDSNPVSNLIQRKNCFFLNRIFVYSQSGYHP